MRWRVALCRLAALPLAALLSSQALAVTTQTASDVFNGRSYLWVEAESFASLGDDPEGNGWTVVSKENPIQAANSGLDILPADSNVSGTALLDEIGGGQHSDTALYELQFLTPGTYQFYSRHSIYDSNDNGNIRNEDSIFLSPGFNLNSSTDWVGFNGLLFDETDPNVDIPNPGFALDPDGFIPAVGDSQNEGWYAIADWSVKSAGVVEPNPTDATSDLWNGNFNWYNRPAFVSTGAGGGFDSDFGFKTEYTVTPEMVGQTVTFEIGTREPYGVFDGFLFIQDDDVNLLDEFTQAQVDEVLVPAVADPGGDGGAPPRSYPVNFTSTPPTIDGTVSPGEWDASAGPTGDWRELRDGVDEKDSDGNRFQIMYDENNLYILYETDYVGGPDNDQWLASFGGNPNIVFGEENLNLYIDPNRDGDLNTRSDGTPSDPEAAHGDNVDGYQLAFNQYEGVSVATGDDRQGTGFFTEAHVNGAFGDQGGWNDGGSNVAGAGIDGTGITVAQNNTNNPAEGQPSGVAEIVIPFADLDAASMVPGPGPNADANGDGVQDAADYTLIQDAQGEDVGNAGDGNLDGLDFNDDGVVNELELDMWADRFGAPGMIPSGLNATDDGARSGPEAGEIWGFNMSMITRDGDGGENFLPIWSFQNAGSFALWPHGQIVFQAAAGGASASAVPEPGALLLLISGLAGLLLGRRSR